MGSNLSTTSKTLFSLGAAFMMIACNRFEVEKLAPETSAEAPIVKARDLQGKSFEEVMVAKYEKASLTCDLTSGFEIQPYVKAIANGMPQSFTWNLLDPASLQQDAQIVIESYNEGQDGRKYRAESKALLHIKSTKIHSRLERTDVRTGTSYKAKFSPSIELEVTDSDSIYDSTELIFRINGYLRSIAYEKMPSSLKDYKSKGFSNFTYASKLECTLTTTPKIEYKNQLIIEPMILLPKAIPPTDPAHAAASE